jgi:arabinogalactan endo-1,4-beta-galactosidase
MMLHIAQPENAKPWFPAARAAGVTGYETIALSYYRKWSKEPMAGLAGTIEWLRRDYGKQVIVVALTQTVVDAAGEGVVYWAPDGVSTTCKTRWGAGLGWDNATSFDAQDRLEALPVPRFLGTDNRRATPAGNSR